MKKIILSMLLVLSFLQPNTYYAKEIKTDTMYERDLDEVFEDEIQYPIEIEEVFVADKDDYKFSLFGSTAPSSSEFISNSKNKQYIDTMIDYYLTNHTELLTNLKAGKPVVLFFEGGSDNVDNSTYNSNTKYRMSAVCIVLKYNFLTNSVYIDYANENCTTMPDHPLAYGKYDNGKGTEYGTATIKDGIYNIYTTNHKGQYAGFNIRTNNSTYVAAVYMKSNGSYSELNASGINIHTRTTPRVSSETNPWSSGCIIVGASTPFTDYNKFVEITAPTNSQRTTTTYQSSSIYQYSSGTNVFCGMVVIDRYLYRSKMMEIYKNQGAIDLITEFSRQCYANAGDSSAEVNITSHSNGDKVDPRRDIEIKWSSVSGAAGYRVAVKCDSGEHQGEKPINNEWTTGTSFTIPYNSLYHNEAYKVWVGAYESKSAANVINGTQGDSITLKVMSGPRIQSPEYNGYTHPANTTISWTKVDSASSYLLTLVNYDTGADVFRNKNIGNNLSYYLNNLEENTTYKVAVGTNDGWWSQGDFFFKTSKFPVIETPECTENSARIEWSKVPGAIDYRLLLKDGAGNVISGYNEISTNGRQYYNITGLQSGKTYIVNVYGVIDGQKLWAKKSVEFTTSSVEEEPIRVTGVTLNQTSTTLEVGEIETLFATVRPTDATNQNVTWKSSNESVASVTQNGEVTAKSAGTATITVTTEEGGHTATCMITVKEVVSDEPGGDTGGNTNDEPVEFTLSWKEYNNGERFAKTIDTSSGRPQRPHIADFEINPSGYDYKTIEISTSDDDVVKVSVNGDSLSITPQAAGYSKVTLTIDGKSIYLEFVIIDSASTEYSDEEDFIFDSGLLIEYIGNDSVVRIPPKIDGITVSVIDESAFSTKNSVTRVVLPEGVYAIWDNAFAYCDNLESIELNEGLKTIGKGAFSGTSESSNKIKNITIPSTVEEIGAKAFDYCRNLESVTFLGDKITVIDDYTFRGCSNLTSITLPNSLAKIGSNSFRKCSALEEIELPESITEIGSWAFSGCENLQTIELPGSLTTINGNAFEYCSSLNNIKIPETVTEIGTATFSDCTSLTNVELPNQLTTIGISLFANCVSLEEIDIPDGVTKIKNAAFGGCTSLRKITIPNTVISIGSNTFSDCDMLTIYGESDTYAETYAKEKGIPFVNTKKTELKTISVDSYQNSSNWCFNVLVEGYGGEATVYAVIYDDNGKMLASTAEELTAENVTTLILSKANCKTGEYVKIFVWENSLKPVALSKEIDIQ